MSVEPEIPRPTPGEWFAATALLLGFLVVNILTYHLYATVWCDDVLWTEPAINLVRTGQFTTSVWQLQPAGSFWAAQSPFYPLALSLWLRMTDFSLLGIRSFNMVLATVGAFLVWVAAWRLRLVRLPAARLLAIPLVLCGYGVSFAYRSSRPDMAGMICLLCLSLAFTAGAGWRRNFLILLFAFLAPWVGVQVALFVAWASLMAWLGFRAINFRELALIAMGGIAGTLTLLAFYSVNGSLEYFMASMSQAAQERAYWGQVSGYLASVPRRFGQAFTAYIVDFSIPPLLLGLLCFVLLKRRTGKSMSSYGFRFLLALLFTIPLLFAFAAHFAFYYSYLIFVPLTLAFLAAFSDLVSVPTSERSDATTATNRKVVRPRYALAAGVLAICAAGSMVVGLPLRLGASSTFAQIAPRAEHLRIIQTQIKTNDVIFCDFPAFFETKQAAQNVFAPTYSKHFLQFTPTAREFSEQEKNSLTLLIISPEKLKATTDYFGGRWEAVSEPFGDSFSLGRWAEVPLIGKRLASHFSGPQMGRYKLQIFRRVSDPAQAEPLTPPGS